MERFLRSVPDLNFYFKKPAVINQCNLNETIARHTLWEVREGDRGKMGWASVGCTATDIAGSSWKEGIQAQRWVSTKDNATKIKGQFGVMQLQAEKCPSWPASLRKPGVRPETDCPSETQEGTSPVTPSSQTSSFPNPEAVPFWCGDWSPGKLIHVTGRLSHVICTSQERKYKVNEKDFEEARKMT